MKLLDHMVALALILFFSFFFSFNSFEEFPFWFLSCCSSLPSYQQRTRVPFSPHLCQYLLFLVLLMMANLNGVKRCLCGFHLHFPDNQWCWAPFHVPIDHVYISPRKMFMWFLFLFSIKLFFLIKKKSYGVLYGFWLLSFYLQCDMWMFPPAP